MQFLAPLLLLVLMYALLVRPQQQRVRRQRELLSSLTVGDRVVTVGGIVGEVVELGDETAALQVADGVVVRFVRPAINRRVQPGDGAALEEAAHEVGVDGEAADELAADELAADELAADELAADDEAAEDHGATTEAEVGTQEGELGGHEAVAKELTGQERNGRAPDAAGGGTRGASGAGDEAVGA
jgi:preprotein translocase subunit YajC